MVKKPTAKYQITDTFKITGRGLVFTGSILDGTINSGDLIEFPVFGQTRLRKITGISLPSNPELSANFISILIKCDNEKEIDEIRNSPPNNTLALIYKEDT